MRGKRQVVARGTLDNADDDYAFAFLVPASKVDPLFHSPGITAGFRRVGLPFHVVVKSLFRRHNETLNIWTHLIPAIIFLALAVYDARARPLHPPDNLARLLITGYSASAATCFALSATYHWFCVYSLRAFRILRSLDLVGIQLLITASYLAALYFSFSCFNTFRALYLGATLAVFALSVSLCPLLDSAGRMVLKNTLFVTAVAWGLIPTFHYIALVGKAGRPFFVEVAKMYSLYAAGFFFFASKLPEAVAWGRVNFAGHSHQLWHLAVVAAAAVWYNSILLFQRNEGYECAGL